MRLQRGGKEKSRKGIFKGSALGFSAHEKRSSQDVLAYNSTSNGLDSGIVGKPNYGGLENIKEEVYLQKGVATVSNKAAANAKNEPLNKHPNQLVISPDSSNYATAANPITGIASAKQSSALPSSSNRTKQNKAAIAASSEYDDEEEESEEEDEEEEYEYESEVPSSSR